jgi:hypothetical protein
MVSIFSSAASTKARIAAEEKYPVSQDCCAAGLAIRHQPGKQSQRTLGITIEVLLA